MSSAMLGRDGVVAHAAGTVDDSSMTALYFDKNASFAKMGLDRRIFKAVAKTGYIYPSLVQTKTIPFILENRDVLVRARTGSGKTAAYVLPIINKILAHIEAVESGNASEEPASEESYGLNNTVQAVILVPTRDLVDQVASTITQFSFYCKDAIRTIALNGDTNSKKTFKMEAAQLKLSPHIIVSTPSRLLQHCEAHNVYLKKSLKHLVVDEADLVLSYGYESDVKALNVAFPEFFQCILMSATLTPELDALRGILLHNPAVVKLDEGVGASQLKQYYHLVPEHEKHLMLFSHIALGVYKGKTLFFVNSIQTAFNIKLFLEQFGIAAAVLNDDLPYNSRRNIVLQFNKGVFDYLIATDLSNSEIDINDELSIDEQVKLHVFDGQEDKVATQGENETDDAFLERLDKKNAKAAAAVKKGKSENKVGAVRGIDFVDVQTVVNFDFPTTYKSYTHRVGRTARAGKAGQAISYVTPSEQEALEQVMEAQSIAEGKDIIVTKETTLKPLPFNPEAAASFRVRVYDAKKKISPKMIKEARLNTLRLELLNSEKLKAHFEDNPHELHLLKHSAPVMKKKIAKELNYVPNYLINDDYKNLGVSGGSIVVGGSTSLLSFYCIHSLRCARIWRRFLRYHVCSHLIFSLLFSS